MRIGEAIVHGYSAIGRFIPGVCIVGLIGFGMTFSMKSYGEPDEELVERAKLDTAKRFIDYYAAEMREFMSSQNPELSSQEIESIVAVALRQRAECEVDAMVKLARDRADLSLALLLDDLAGREVAGKDDLMWSRITKEQFEIAVQHCDEQYYSATTR